MISMFTDLGVGVLFWAGGRHEVVLLFSFLLKVDTPPFLMQQVAWRATV